MKQRVTLTSVIITIIAVLYYLLIFNDGSPNTDEAKKQFQLLYPDVRIISVDYAMTEVVAVSFLFRYQKPNSNTIKTIEIQFMDIDNTKHWRPSPPPPKELP